MDSWSVQNDVPSGESISYNNRDYTPLFNTDQVFESRDDMLDWVRKIGLENGIVVVIKKSANLRGGKKPKCILGCERGGEYKPPRNHVEGQSMQRKTGTRKCGCPFELRGIPIPPNYVMWGLSVFCGFHNHQPAEYLDGHEYPSRLKPVEKEYVVELGDSAAPREILTILKEKYPSNTTGIKSIYNAISKNKVEKRAGLTQIQYVLQQLINKGYLHQFLTNPETNEITDIIWVHPRSLKLFIYFPSVLIIDATYKTNEYRIPLLEVVGITSTMKTYSLMFAHLSNEREEQLTWALNGLKGWMIGNGALLPSVLVSDRDLALIKAIETCFPTARHILCIWHINQCVMKRCRPQLGTEWDNFCHSWHSLINSSTQRSYQHKWEAMCEEYNQFPGVLKYLSDTWLSPYGDRFISAWIDTFMHLGSNSSQRAESAHARLKRYLGDTMSSLQISFDKIDKMLGNQFGDIQKSFEKSIHIPRHEHLHDFIYDRIRSRISLNAMEMIQKQVNLASNIVSPHCRCVIKKIYGLPCQHDIAHYYSTPMPIPLESIHVHWTRLSMNAPRTMRHNRTSDVVDILEGMDPSMREHMIDRIIDMTDPAHSTVRAPSYNTEHRGRPTGRDEQSRAPVHSGSTSRSRVNRPTSTTQDGVHNTEASVPEDLYIHHFPELYRRYISQTIDVVADGHCGFRAIAALIGYGEDGWRAVRYELIEELQQNWALYEQLYPKIGHTNTVMESLNCFERTAPQRYWMDSIDLGVVIASRYNLVLHTFDSNPNACFSHLPLRSPPVPIGQRREIAIGRVNNNHFVQVFLYPRYPVPPIIRWWFRYSSSEAKGWSTYYVRRVRLWFTLMGTAQNGSGTFGGDID